jgi:hypothetical protein
MIPPEWYKEPWKRVRLWVLKDAGRRFDAGLYDDEDQTDIGDSSGDEGYSDVRERKRLRFLQKALDDVWKSRKQWEENWYEDKRKIEEERKENLANHKLMRKDNAKKKLLLLADQLRCRALLNEKRQRLRSIGRRYVTLTSEERDKCWDTLYNKGSLPMMQDRKTNTVERARESSCESITERSLATYRLGAQKLSNDLRLWICRKDKDRKEREEESKEIRLRRRIKKWFSMNAQERKVYSKRQLLVAKQKKIAKMRRSMMKDGGLTKMKWTVSWGLDSRKRKARERWLKALPVEARKKMWEGRRFEFGFPEGVLINP